MLHEYHVIYSVRYYPRFHLTAVGLGKYYVWIRGYYCICYFSQLFAYFSGTKNTKVNAVDITSVTECPDGDYKIKILSSRPNIVGWGQDYNTG
jgi:hypothetical protein